MVRRVVLVFLGLALIVPTPAVAGVTEVQVVDSEFVPDDVTTEVSGSVRWASSGTVFPHNVRQDRRLFRNGDPTSSAFEFIRVVSAGTFHYYCEVHGSATGGMDGLVRVPVTLTARPDGLPFLVRWATRNTNTGSAFDVRFRIDDGPWRAWKTDTTRLAQVFGSNGNPVRVRRGHEYDFQARSQVQRDTPRRVSRWSPVASWMT